VRFSTARAPAASARSLGRAAVTGASSRVPGRAAALVAGPKPVPWGRGRARRALVGPSVATQRAARGLVGTSVRGASALLASAVPILGRTAFKFAPRGTAVAAVSRRARPATAAEVQEPGPSRVDALVAAVRAVVCAGAPAA
jgi:hypothetical protein